MPHLRNRDALPLLRKKLSFSPVLSIQGARQTGKSTLARDVLHGQHYLTLDRPSALAQARTSTEIFLEEARTQAEGRLLVIDEAQKAPILFDAIKYLVDQDRRPGQFLLLGSTEFSKEMLVRESLTGRMSRLRLFPMTFGESRKSPFRDLDDHGLFPAAPRFNRAEMVRYLEHGGYPGIFAVREASERTQRWNDLVSLTCERDALMFPRLKGDSFLCQRILSLAATLEEPTRESFASKLRTSGKKIATQLEILTQLFMLHPVRPHPLGTGKIRYYLNDPGLAAHLQAPFERRLETAAYLELLARRAYSEKSHPDPYFYRTSKGSSIHFVTEGPGKKLAAQKLVFGEKIDRREFEVLLAFRKKAEAAGYRTQIQALCAQAGHLKKEELGLIPWEAIG